MLNHIARRYYQHRQYEMPNPQQALLFLISEIGELTEAYLKSNPNLAQDECDTFQAAQTLGLRADGVVSGQKAWVRNNDRVNEPDLQDEIGDVLLMLVVFALTLGFEVAGAMYRKMTKKGFDAYGAIGEALSDSRY